jgi:DNA-binding SARP family transcriptional activator
MEMPFVAELRQNERSQLREWLQQVAQGNGSILFITGNWGMGRTSMMRYALMLAAEQGLITADSWCRGGHGEPAWMPLASLMEQLLRQFGADPQAQSLAEPLRNWMAFPQSWHIPAQFIRPLRQLARKRGILLGIDDFHLAHENLIRLIQGWLSGIRFEPMGLLLTVCTPVGHPALYELMRQAEAHGLARTLHLAPLTVPEVKRLMALYLGEEARSGNGGVRHASLSGDDELARALHERTGGTLLFLVEILRHPEEWAAEWQQHRFLPSRLPTSLRAMLTQRVQSLSARERELLKTLSCFEGVIPLEILPALHEVKEAQLKRSLAHLLKMGWLEPTQDQPPLWAWRHPLARELLHETLPPAARARLHRQIAALLERYDREMHLLPPEQHWFHWMRSAPDEVVLAKLWEAHQQARLRSHPRFRLELLDACLHAASQLNDTSKRIQLLCERPHLLFCLPDGLLHALNASQQAIAELGAYPEFDPDRTLWVQVHCARAGQLAQLGRTEEARATLITLLEQGNWSGSQQSMLELTLAYLDACQGDVRNAYEGHKRVWQRMRADGKWWRRWAGTLHYTLRYALACGDEELTQDVLAQFTEWTMQPDAPPAWKSLWHLLQAEFAFFEGRGAEQLYHARALHLIEAPDESSTHSWEIGFQTMLFRDPTEALHAADRALARVRQAVGYEREAEWLCCRAQALLELERWQDALTTLQEARRLARKLNHRLALVRSYLLQAQMMLLTHREGESLEPALELLEQAEPLVDHLNLPELTVEWHRLRSIALQKMGDEAAALMHAQQAVACAEQWGHALYRGLTYLQLLSDPSNPSDLSQREHAESLLSGYGAPLWWRRTQAPSTEGRPVGSPVLSERGYEIEVRMLGEVRIRFRGRQLPPDGWVSPRTRALFCHLVLMQGRPLHSDTLCESHFPHLELERARVNLQTTISAARRSLRRALSEEAGEWLRYERGLYRWAPEHSWAADAFEFERIARDALALADVHAQMDRLQDALSLYRGDLLPEFAEEAWCNPAYHRLRALFLECLLTQARLASLQGYHHKVVEYAEQLLQHDACDEAAARLLMQAYEALGRRADALQVYARCQQALAELLDTTPAEPTRQLYEAMLKR